MTFTDGLVSRSLGVPGARLHYEVRGSGPLLLVIGSPMPAAAFTPVAHALASDHTVVTYDPRGLAASTIDDPTQDATPDLRADDVAAIIEALDAGPADVFGSSGGAVTGLALVTRHPNRVGTLIAHEPPLTGLLPEAEQQRAAVDDIIATFHRDGPAAAWRKFMANAGFDLDHDAGPPPGPEPSAAQLAEQVAEDTRFFDHELRLTVSYRPDIEALRAARVIIGIGVDSRRLLAYRTSHALAALIGVTPVDFPDGHTGFLSAPAAFAVQIRDILGD
jgi:pimeloyl-ACP methyl ester carboxylesterase